MNDYRILVVDDEEDLCEILKFNLENEGYFVDTANSAEEALKMELTQYNLLLLDVTNYADINMLKLNGITVAMANGIAEAKEAAKYVSEYDNNHNGVTLFLHKIEKGL